MVTSYTNRAMRRRLPLSRISEMDGRPVRARTADLYRVNERSDGTSSTYEYFSEHSVAVRAVRNSYCSHVVPPRAGWRTAFWESGKPTIRWTEPHWSLPSAMQWNFDTSARARISEPKQSLLYYPH